jgi:exodeoxyribonuclease VII large subunit
MNETIGLYQLNNYIQQSLELNFSTEIWIHCEISNAKISRGHWYFDLIEKDPSSNRIIAKAQGIVWKTNAKYIEDQNDFSLRDILDLNAEVKIKVNVDFHQIYGLKLIVTDIDPNYTIGKLEMERRRTIERLEEEGLMDLNGGIPLPLVIQKLAIISSQNAAGFADFENELKTNPYGYAYQLKLFPSAVQGEKAAKEMIRALNKIQKSKDCFDLIIITRGGGSKLDLTAFDDYELCSVVSACSLPVFTGIGHEIDLSVLDLVSHSQFKTPTAVASGISQHNALFESRIEQLYRDFTLKTQDLISNNNLRLQSLYNQLHFMTKSKIVHQFDKITRRIEQFKETTRKRIEREKEQLESNYLEISLRSPTAILEQGYAYLEQDQRRISSVLDFNSEQKLQIHLKDGLLEAEEAKIKENE